MEQMGIDLNRVEWRHVDNEIVALDLQNSDYFTLNSTGAVLWTRLLDGATRAELLDALVQEFDVSSEAVGADVDDFLAKLDQRGLLTRGQQ